jgi:outer membrane protein TolC
MMSMKRFYYFVGIFIGLSLLLMVQGGFSLEHDQAANMDTEPLSIDAFIELAAQNDTVFEEILIDQLPLAFQKDLKLPARDIVLSVKSQYDVFIGPDRDDLETSFGLSKLFPNTGTDVEAEIKDVPSFTSTDSASEFTFSIAQPIAENAFGKTTRIKDKIIGVEIDVAKHQIAEAYEDYLAALFLAYYTWYEDYENFKVADSSYQENIKLLDNIKERQNSKIALPIDVNKTNIQVLTKKEKLVDLKEKYQRGLHIIQTAIRYTGKKELVPQIPNKYYGRSVSYEKEYEDFKQNSRTYQILDLLEKKSKLSVKENAVDLLPSIDLLIGYKVKGDNLQIENEDNMYYAGVSIDWPLTDQVEKAEYETAKIDLKKTGLTINNTYFKLYTDLKNLYLEIERERELSEIAKEKIELAKSILEDETENYSFGKVTLNDYIDAVNTLDNNRFNQILHNVKLRKLIVEWLRITDQLISMKDIKL